MRRGSKRTFRGSLIHSSPKGAWQQVTWIEDLCHAQVSHKWLHHLDACAGSVLKPHDYITNVQKRLGNIVWVGGGQCRCCGSFLDRRALRLHSRGALCVCTRCSLRLGPDRPGHHYGTQRAHCFAIQAS